MDMPEEVITNQDVVEFFIPCVRENLLKEFDDDCNLKMSRALGRLAHFLAQRGH